MKFLKSIVADARPGFSVKLMPKGGVESGARLRNENTYNQGPTYTVSSNSEMADGISKSHGNNVINTKPGRGETVLNHIEDPVPVKSNGPTLGQEERTSTTRLPEGGLDGYESKSGDIYNNTRVDPARKTHVEINIEKSTQESVATAEPGVNELRPATESHHKENHHSQGINDDIDLNRDSRKEDSLVTRTNIIEKNSEKLNAGRKVVSAREDDAESYNTTRYDYRTIEVMKPGVSERMSAAKQNSKQSQSNETQGTHVTTQGALLDSEQSDSGRKEFVKPSYKDNKHDSVELQSTERKIINAHKDIIQKSILRKVVEQNSSAERIVEKTDQRGTEVKQTSAERPQESINSHEFTTVVNKTVIQKSSNVQSSHQSQAAGKINNRSQSNEVKIGKIDVFIESGTGRQEKRSTKGCASYSSDSRNYTRRL